MKQVSSENFGLLIAYIVPGLTALWGASYLSATIRSWMSGPAIHGPTIGGFLFATIAAVGTGLVVSTIRWALIDTLHHATGLSRPRWDFARLQEHFDVYDRLERNHYVFYQFYSNMIVALFIAYFARRIGLGFWSLSVGWTELGFLFLVVVFLAGSRDTLAKYYTRVEQLIGDHHGSCSTGP